MLHNYFKIAFRSLLRNGTYSFITIFGLSAGIAVSLIIFLFVAHELSFDKFHPKADRIYRMTGKVNYGGQLIQLSGMSAGMGPVVKLNHPEVENYVRIQEASKSSIQSDEQHLDRENKLLFADTSLFTVFNFPLLSGNYRSLAKPRMVVLTSAMANKYFGSTDVIGKTIIYNGEYPLEIAGILKDLPSNSSLTFDFVVSFSTLGTIPSQRDNYINEKAEMGNYTTYLLVGEPSSLKKIGTGLSANSPAEFKIDFEFHPFATIHERNSYLYLFSAVAVIILLLALINYMNLTTATATLRSREVGVRKVIGARRSHLAFQFYFESAVMTLIAFALAVVWIELLLPVFLNSLGLKIDTAFLASAWFILIAAGLLVGCILLAGSYPSLVLSKFKPVDGLKGKAGASGSNWIRKSFTVFQFAASVSLIMITIGIQYQLEFMRNQKLGFNKEQVMVVSLNKKSGSIYNALKNDIRAMSGVRQVAAAGWPMYTEGHTAIFMKTPVTHEDVFMNILTVDENFISTLGIEWLEKPDTLAKRGYIVNEAALEKLKITKAQTGINLDLGDKQFPMTGVVKNFNYESLHSPVAGLMFSIASDTSSALTQTGASLYIRLDPKSDVRDNVAAIKKIYQHYQTGQPFEYYFLDDAFQKLFKSEDQLASIFDVFTTVAIILACLGLFGLITFNAQIRTKEIGIRKVLGASVSSIFVLLSKDFALLIVAGVVIAVPVAVFYINDWLTQFPERIEVQWWFAVVAAMTAFAFALITISAQVIKAGRGNPVDALRRE